MEPTRKHLPKQKQKPFFTQPPPPPNIISHSCYPRLFSYFLNYQMILQEHSMP